MKFIEGRVIQTIGDSKVTVDLSQRKVVNLLNVESDRIFNNVIVFPIEVDTDGVIKSGFCMNAWHSFSSDINKLILGDQWKAYCCQDGNRVF